MSKENLLFKLVVGNEIFLDYVEQLFCFVALRLWAPGIRKLKLEILKLKIFF